MTDKFYSPENVKAEVPYKGKRIYPLRFMDGHVEWRVSDPTNGFFYERCSCEEEARLYIDAGCPMNAKWTEHPKYVAWRQKQSVAA